MNDQGPEYEDLDDEMKRLIEGLDAEDSPVEKMADSSPPLNLDNPPPANETYREVEPALQPTDVRKLDLTPPTTAVVVEPETPIVDLRQQFDSLNNSTEEIIHAARADRQEVQDAINLYRGEIDKAIGHNVLPNRGYLDNLVKALEVKANVNITAVKAIELRVKMLAALKSGLQIGVNINNANGGGSDQGLIDVLESSPLDSTGADEW